MESQPQNPEFRNNPENFHPCIRCMFFLLLFLTLCMPILFFDGFLLVCRFFQK